MSKGFLIVSQYYIFVLNQFEEEAEDGCRGSDEKNKPETTEQEKDESDTDLDKKDHVKVKRTRRQSKKTPIRRSRWVKGCLYRDNKGVDKGLSNRRADRAS